MQAPSAKSLEVEQETESWGLGISGGGLSAAYGIGALSGLIWDLGLPRPKVLVGSSASSPTVLLNNSDQIANGLKVWRDVVTSPNMLSQNGSRVKRMDVARVVRAMRARFDFSAFLEDDSRSYIMATDYETGEPMALDARLASNSDELSEMTRASMALDIEPVLINGRKYIDGDLSSSEMQKSQLIKDHGVDHTVMIRCARPETLHEMGRILAVAPKRAKEIYRGNKLQLMRPADFDECTIVGPSQKLACGLLLSNDPADIEATIEMGREDVRNSLALKALAKKLA